MPSGLHFRKLYTTYTLLNRQNEVLGVYLFFLLLIQNIDCGHSLAPPNRSGSNVYIHQ